MGATVYFLVRAGRLMGVDNTGFNNALKGRIASQAATVGFIVLGAWSLKRKSYNRQIENEIITGKSLLYNTTILPYKILLSWQQIFKHGPQLVLSAEFAATFK